jgi:hypothetical protein
MNLRQLLAYGTSALILAACESGDINLNPTVVDNSVSSGGGTAPVNPCASYTEAGQTFAGTVDVNNNCVYDALFVSDTRPITVSAITFPLLAGGAKHIFQDSLYIGEDVDANTAATGKRIPQEGEGTKLTIAAGNTMVFTQPDSYVRIARGSQIFAEGSASAPITFTADEDAILGVANENSRGLWGGIQINGNGRTNKCSDGTATGSGPLGQNDFAPTANNVHNCHVTAEGRPATYGGNNNSEDSGTLKYVVIKHAGYEVVDGNELNALTLNAVGSGTTISYVETYTTQDDGFEMFGGAVNMDHIVAVNAGDDSIDYSEGYTADIQYALVLHTSGANRCIEGDNTGVGRSDVFTPSTKLRISNMTCITSNVDVNQGVNASSKGDSEGSMFREGAHFELYNSIMTSHNVSMGSNECLRVEDTEGPDTIDAMQANTSIARSNLIACSEPLRTTFGTGQTTNSGFSLAIWLAGGDGSALTPYTCATPPCVTNNVVEGTNLPANIIVGGTGTRGYLTAATITNSLTNVLFDQATQLYNVDHATTGVQPPSPLFQPPTYLGAANAGDDWPAGWTVGLTGPLP